MDHSSTAAPNSATPGAGHSPQVLPQSPTSSRTQRDHASQSPLVIVACHAWNGDTIGGAFKLATEYAQYMARAGWRVVYVCSKPSTEPGDACEFRDGLEIWRYPAPQRSGWLALAQHVRSTRRIIRNRLRREAAPVAAVVGHSPLQYWGALQATARQQVPKTYVVHSPFAAEVLAGIDGRPSWTVRVKARIAQAIERRVLQLSTTIQVLSQFTRQLLLDTHGTSIADKITVAPGWVDLEQFTPHADRLARRTQLPSPWHTTEPIFFTVRRLEQRMGLDTLIEAVRLLVHDTSQPSPPFRVLIGGGGPQREALEQQVLAAQVQDRVQFLGRIPQADLSTCYAVANAFLLPTRALECFGLIVLEAFATGTPVIAARTGAIPELLSVEGDEWLFTAGDAAALASRLRRFLAGTLTATGSTAPPDPAVLRHFAERYDAAAVLRTWSQISLGQTVSRE